jgi:hypothetical protein
LKEAAAVGDEWRRDLLPAFVAASPELAPGVSRFHFRNSRSVVLALTSDLPEIPFGAGMYGVRPEGISAFVDMKFVPGPEPFYDSRDEGLEQATLRGHAVRDVVDQWVSLSGGITRTLGPGLAAFGGVGIAWRNQYYQFHGAHSRFGEGGWEYGYGTYWVPNRSFIDFSPSLLGGAFIRVHSQWVAQVGAQTRPRGVVFGFGYSLPYYYPRLDG